MAAGVVLDTLLCTQLVIRTHIHTAEHMHENTGHRKTKKTEANCLHISTDNVCLAVYRLSVLYA